MEWVFRSLRKTGLNDLWKQTTWGCCSVVLRSQRDQRTAKDDFKNSQWYGELQCRPCGTVRCSAGPGGTVLLSCSLRWYSSALKNMPWWSNVLQCSAGPGCVSKTFFYPESFSGHFKKNLSLAQQKMFNTCKFFWKSHDFGLSQSFKKFQKYFFAWILFMSLRFWVKK